MLGSLMEVGLAGGASLGGASGRRAPRDDGVGSLLTTRRSLGVSGSYRGIGENVAESSRVAPPGAEGFLG